MSIWPWLNSKLDFYLNFWEVFWLLFKKYFLLVFWYSFLNTILRTGSGYVGQARTDYCVKTNSWWKILNIGQVLYANFKLLKCFFENCTCWYLTVLRRSIYHKRTSSGFAKFLILRRLRHVKNLPRSDHHW